MKKMMSIIASIGWAMIVLATFGILGAVFLEFQAHEPIYTLIMKVCCLLIAVAGVLIGLG